MSHTHYQLVDVLLGRDPDGRLLRALDDPGSALAQAARRFLDPPTRHLESCSDFVDFLSWIVPETAPMALSDPQADSRETIAPRAHSLSLLMGRMNGSDEAQKQEAIQELLNRQLDVLCLTSTLRSDDPVTTAPMGGGGTVAGAAQSALWSLIEGIKDGKYPRVRSRDDLWGHLIQAVQRRLQYRSPEQQGPRLAFTTEELRGGLLSALGELFESLDDRQRDIAQRRLTHKSRAAIAEDLDMLKDTVDAYLQAISAKIDEIGFAA